MDRIARLVFNPKVQYKRFINMKRHPSLAHLSRDHHGALLLARLLQNNAPAYTGMPTDTAGKADYAFKFYNDELIKHFASEESALKIVSGINETLDGLIATVFREHQELHAAFQSINHSPELSEHLDMLGKSLEIHVRKEERELFPLIEATCSEPLLEQINQLLSAHL
jgi:hypothetical protein